MDIDKRPVLMVIDDDDEIRYSLQRVFAARGYALIEAASGEEGIKLAEKTTPEVVLLDNRMEGISGLETLQHLRSVAPDSMVILMTAYGTTQTAIEAMKFGAFDYIIKPFDLKKIIQLVEKAHAAYTDLHRVESQQGPLLNSDDYQEGIVGTSDRMQEVFKMVGQVASSDATVMITGESGTGKELIARAIFQHSHRSNQPFVAVNCAAIPENLIESELFGHEKGSFTGATAQRIGRFELCDGGTIFLDEIGDMSLSTQTKILRALQEGEIQRVGGTETIKVDVRMLAATNRNLEKLVKKKEFREDLYYRLNVVRLRLPSLRERKEDIPQLVDFMIQRLVKAEKVRANGISPEALQILVNYDWPGNVRELENVIYRSAVVAQGDTILIKDLPAELVKASDDGGAQDKTEPVAPEPGSSAQEAAELEVPTPVIPKESPILPDDIPILIGATKPNGSPDSMEPGAPVDLEQAFNVVYDSLREESDLPLLPRMEKVLIRRVLEETGGNQVKAATLLGITRGTLRKRIDLYELS